MFLVRSRARRVCIGRFGPIGLLATALGLAAAGCGDSQPAPSSKAETPAAAERAGNANGASDGAAAHAQGASDAKPKASASASASASNSAAGLPAPAKSASHALVDAHPAKPLAVGEVAHEPGGIRLTLNMAAGWETPQIQNGVVLVVPEGRELRVEAISAEIVDASGRTSPASVAALKDALTIARVGVMRHWPLAAIHWDGARVDDLRRGGATAAPPRAFRARLAVTWAGESIAPGAPPHPEELAAESPWRRAAEAVVANPEGLAVYQLARPPINSEASIAPTDPRLAVSGGGANRAWVRLRLSEEGFYRLDLAGLERAGLTGAAAAPERIVAMRRGRAVPLLWGKGPGGAPELYLWNEPNPSEFTRESVYWFSLAAESVKAGESAKPGEAAKAGNLEPAPLALNEISVSSKSGPDGPTDLGAEPKTIATTRLTARRDENHELLISYGDFRDVRAMRWADAKIDVAKDQASEQAFDLALPGFVPDGAPLRATVNFYFLLAQQRKSPVPAADVRVVVATDDGRTTELAFETDLDALRTIEIRPEAIRDGKTTLRMKLAEPLKEGGIDQVWLDWIEASYTANVNAAGAAAGALTLRDAESAPDAGPGANGKTGSDPETELRATLTKLGDEPTARGRIGVTIGPDGPRERPRIESASVSADAKGEGGIRVVWRGGPGTRTEIRRADDARVASAFEPAKWDNLTATDQGADYLIISHADFIPGLQPLAELRQRGGHRVRVVDVQSVYDNFSYGEATPLAIRDFLAHALAEWRGGAPTHVLLVGDCSSDYRDYAGMGVKNYTPTYAFDASGDRWASDEWMGMVAGDDPLPDYMIGRISVNNPTDLARVVEKTIFYGERYPFGPWRARLAHVCDNEPVFPAAMDRLTRERRPAGFSSDALRLNEFPMVDNFYSSDAARKATFEQEGRLMKVSVDATARLLKMFRDGPALLTFFGHGSPNIWTTERIWFGGDSVNSDNLQLTDAVRTPIVVNLTCNSGAIDYPIPKWNINIMEDMMRVKSGGAVAAWVPSGPGQTDMQEQLARVFYEKFFEPGTRSIGEKILAAKTLYAATLYPDEFRNSYTTDYVRMYILLGDPALEPQIPASSKTFSMNRLVFAPGEIAQATLEGVRPERGQFELRLMNEEGEPVWSSEPRDYEGGTIDARAPLPADAPPGPFTLSLYAWNEAERAETLAWSEGRVGASDDRITTAALEPSASGGFELNAHLENAGDLPGRGLLEARWVAAGADPLALTSGTLATASYALEPGERREVRLHLDRADGAGLGEGRFLEARLVPNRAASDLARPAGDFVRLASPGGGAPPPAAPLLRLVPESVRFAPASPSEGETILVSVDVENVGSRASSVSTVTLFEGDPAAGGRTAYNQNLQEIKAPNAVELGRLGPGRRRALTFRWDPSFNAGDQPFWIRLDPGGDDIAVAQEHNYPLAPEWRNLRGGVHVRTKAKLSYRLKPAPPADRNRMTVIVEAEILNEGETEARNVSVAFFKGGGAKPENKVYETTLDALPPGSVTPVKYEWEFGTAAVYRQGLGIQVWMKGSSLRMISAHETLQ